MASAFPAYVAQGHDGTVVRDYTPGTDSNEPFLVGDFVYFDTSDNVMQLCGTNPSLIAGISETSSAAHTVLTPDGKVPVRIITTFDVILALSSSTTPAASHIGDQYGITRTGSAPFQWQLDTAKTAGDARALILDVDITNGIFLVQMLNTELQFAAIA